jgi:hypothetical protein
VKISQAYTSFSCIKLTSHCTSGGCIIVIIFYQWVWGICLRNDVTAEASLSQRAEQIFLIVNNEAHHQLSDWLLGEMILLA